MFNAEIRKMLIQVISSWQVIVVTVVLILYVFLVNYVARIYHRSRRSSGLLLPKAKPEAAPPIPAPSESDDLGLEEEARPGKNKPNR